MAVKKVVKHNNLSKFRDASSDMVLIVSGHTSVESTRAYYRSTRKTANEILLSLTLTLTKEDKDS